MENKLFTLAHKGIKKKMVKTIQINLIRSYTKREAKRMVKCKVAINSKREKKLMDYIKLGYLEV